MRVAVRSFAKINLGLYIGAGRADYRTGTGAQYATGKGTLFTSGKWLSGASGEQQGTHQRERDHTRNRLAPFDHNRLVSSRLFSLILLLHLFDFLFLLLDLLLLLLYLPLRLRLLGLVFLQARCGPRRRPASPCRRRSPRRHPDGRLPRRLARPYLYQRRRPDVPSSRVVIGVPEHAARRKKAANASNYCSTSSYMLML